MIGAQLLLVAVAVAVGAPRVLAGAGFTSRSPRAGIAAWYAVFVALSTAVVGGVVALLAPWAGVHSPVCVAWRWCAVVLGGGHGPSVRLAGYTLVVGLTIVAGRALLVVIRAARAGAARRREHLATLALAGRPSPRLGATVVEHAAPAAYVVAGRRRRVVVTTGALAALTDDELAAVLAHEHAHAAGRHDLLIDGIRLLQRAFPTSHLLACARHELTLLVEMRADDIAARDHGRISLARALVAMAAHPVQPAPAANSAGLALLAATGGDALARMNRLLDPPAPLRRGQRWVLAGGLGLLAIAPLGLVLATQAFPTLGLCPTMS